MKKTEALAHFKTQKRISEILKESGYKASQPAVSKWGEIIPEVPARILAEKSGGALVFIESYYRIKAA